MFSLQTIIASVFSSKILASPAPLSYTLLKPAACDISRNAFYVGAPVEPILWWLYFFLQLSPDFSLFCACFSTMKIDMVLLDCTADGSVAVIHVDKTLPHCSARARWLDCAKEQMNWGWIFFPLCWTWIQCVHSWWRSVPFLLFGDRVGAWCVLASVLWLIPKILWHYSFPHFRKGIGPPGPSSMPTYLS